MRKRSQEIRFDNLATWDIETSNWDEFVVGGLYTERGGRPVFRHAWDEREYCRLLEGRGGEIWGWNCGGYDGLWYLDAKERIRSNDKMHFVMSGSRAIRIDNLNRGLSLCDAMGILPYRLDKMAEAIGKRKKEFPYEKIHRDMSPSDRSLLLEYLEHDCHCTYHILLELRRWHDKFNWKLNITMGSSAWATAQHLFGLPKAEWEPKLYRSTREALYGGRVHVQKHESAAGVWVDNNSAYVARMRDEKLPCGKMSEYTGKELGFRYKVGKAGIVTATVQVPDSDLAPLPMRLKEGGIVFPHGEFTGTWCTNELRYAEETGVKIKEFHYGILWSDAQVIFGKATEEFFEARKSVGTDSAWGKYFKQLWCSIYGKCAQDPERRVVIRDPEAVSFCAAPDCHDKCSTGAWGNKCCVHRCTGECGAWQHVAGKYYSRTVWQLSSCSHVQWGAFITAAQRCAWHRAASLVLPYLVYGDTDSLAIEFPGNLPEWMLGLELGQWKQEGEYQELEVEAPKLYSCYFRKHESPYAWGEKVASRGVPIKTLADARYYTGSSDSWPVDSQIIVSTDIKTRETSRFALYDRGVDSLSTSLLRHPEKMFQRKNLRRTHKKSRDTRSRDWREHVQQTAG